MLSDLSWASSTIIASYLSKSGSLATSASKIPSVISFKKLLSIEVSAKRTWCATPPSTERNSSDILLATEIAAKRRGWVCPIKPLIPNPASRQIFGNCVVFPEPVSPATISV